MAAAGAQCLLRRPQRVAALGCAHDEQIDEVNTRRRQGRRIRHMRRGDQHHAPPGSRQGGERGQNELQLADARPVGEELGQGLPRPAGAGELGIERGKAAWQRGNGLRQAAAAPHRMPLEYFGQGDHTVFSYSIGHRGKGFSAPFSTAGSAPRKRP